MQLGVSYFGNRFVEHYRGHDLPDIARAGCDFVVHTFSEHDVAFYTDSLRAMVEATHADGLEVWLDPWGVGGLFAGEAFSDFLVRNPQSRVVDTVGGLAPMACPNAPETRALLLDWVDKAASIGADAIFWDDPTSVEGGCVCTNCQELFRSRHGTGLTGLEGAAVRQFHHDSLRAFLDDMTQAASAHGLGNVAGVLPRADLLAQAVEMGAVRTVATSPLWQAHSKPVDDYVRQACMDTVARCRAGGKQPMAWLQAFGLPAGSEGDIVRAASIMRECGIEAVAAWSYRGGEPMTGVRSERPSEAWEAVKEAFRLLKG